MTTSHTITIRFAGLTWQTSRVDGVSASATEGPEAAARRLAFKLWGDGTAAHASEAGITASAADWWIANDGSIEDLQLQARALAGHLKNPMGYAQ